MKIKLWRTRQIQDERGCVRGVKRRNGRPGQKPGCWPYGQRAGARPNCGGTAGKSSGCPTGPPENLFPRQASCGVDEAS
ncbi:hypothetical protein NL676_022274 [Syzygium grande]|nr:hypothetical protein NL676_022274 [Syzygium grande]